MNNKNELLDIIERMLVSRCIEVSVRRSPTNRQWEIIGFKQKVKRRKLEQCLD
ncbi:ATP-dependent DNA helicase RecQ-like protein [Bacillus phage Shbh1]|uniref:ATP-dependent DNA helicase RecQ-like protein n=1 Tax=Bacillus phage Shbh1 TaxID=1796992 RepID=A0A142F162_9CAUD|nr:ATP-dependent DNA helicase RecQ-like protein [Bacillus phage Shbh1]AMQ66519.1 ATP-dependent DNA helicase RecQ-like protein [Bacillus phage Shbh1]